MRKDEQGTEEKGIIEVYNYELRQKLVKDLLQLHLTKNQKISQETEIFLQKLVEYYRQIYKVLEKRTIESTSSISENHLLELMKVHQILDCYQHKVINYENLNQYLYRMDLDLIETLNYIAGVDFSFMIEGIKKDIQECETEVIKYQKVLEKSIKNIRELE